MSPWNRWEDSPYVNQRGPQRNDHGAASEPADGTSLFLDDGDVRLYHGDALDVLKTLPAESVHCCVTSPPFYGLRDYGTGRWDGGNPDCDHLGEPFRTKAHLNQNWGEGYADVKNAEDRQPFKSECGKCGARRVDQQIGLEETPEAWVASLVRVFREVRRVLRPEGTLWLEVGDSYAHSSAAGGGSVFDNGRTDGRKCYEGDKARGRERVATPAPGCKPKDLIGAPWMLAFALRADGWWLRSDIVWARPNPMPESVTDRPTKSHSYVFLLAKQPRYYWDAEAVREPAKWERWGDQTNDKHEGSESAASWIGSKSKEQLQGGRQARRYDAEHFKTTDERSTRFQGPNPDNGGRNVRSVWNIATQPYPEAHFATFPEELARRCILAGTSERGCCPECGAPWVRVTESGGGGASHHGARQAIDPETFGRMLQERRESLGLSRRDVAAHFPSKTGGLTGIIWNWENGLAPPSPKEWPRLRELLQIGGEYDHLFVVQEATTDGWKANERGPLVSGKSGLAGSGDRAKQLRTAGWLSSCDCHAFTAEPPDMLHPAVAPCVILDPFVGSGTVPHVARKHGRHAIGIDLSSSYLELAARRLQQLSLFAQVTP